MALTISCKECGDCAVFFKTTPISPFVSEGECRLNPPTSVKGGARAFYPVVTNNTPGCSCGSKMRKPAPKKKPAAKKVPNES